MKIIFISMMLVGFMCCGAYAQQPSQPSVVIWTPFPISLSLVAEGKDGHGTDVKNIYKLTIDFADAKYANGNKYTIMYFEDNRPLQEFKNQSLPFVLKRNYKGLKAGDHVIKIDVEDGKGTVLATNKATIHVTH